MARAGIDGFLTISNGDDADPARLLAEADLPGGLMNYDRFSGPRMTAELEQARSPANAGKRAVAPLAEKLTMQQLSWIPTRSRTPFSCSAAA
jgi:hypothetical protein